MHNGHWLRLGDPKVVAKAPLRDGMRNFICMQESLETALWFVNDNVIIDSYWLSWVLRIGKSSSIYLVLHRCLETLSLVRRHIGGYQSPQITFTSNFIPGGDGAAVAQWSRVPSRLNATNASTYRSISNTSIRYVTPKPNEPPTACERLRFAMERIISYPSPKAHKPIGFNLFRSTPTRHWSLHIVAPPHSPKPSTHHQAPSIPGMGWRNLTRFQFPKRC
ncbi:hypothetical protein TNCV_1727101 [Trichonephila clavipes]|nr:hypothetical protein TNCV_1727101 [Trichonephila clavipes]